MGQPDKIDHNDPKEIHMKARWLSVSAAAVLALAAAQANAEEGLELAKKSGCLACHAVDHKVVGPAWQDVANKYKGQAEISATLTDGSVVKGSPKEVLTQKVHKGGKGNWTEVTHGVPMPPYSPRVSDADISKLVDFVLGLAK
jgi:cytochrome c